MMMFSVAVFKRLNIFTARPKCSCTLPKVIKRTYLSLPKDVNVYSNDAKGFVRLVGCSGFGQWLVVTYMSTVLYQNLPSFFKWIPSENSDGKSRRLPRADWKYRLGFALFTFSASFAVMATSFIYCFRLVSSITLLKTSDKVLFTTYTPVGTHRNFVALVKNVSAIQPRVGSMMQVPMKIKNYSFHFLVDKAGKFPQPTLFDKTVGVKRDFGLEKKK